MVFPVVMYGCESWTVKKAECQRIDALELWCWKRLLRVPWTVRRSKQVNPKGSQSRIFIERTDAEVEAPILWPPDAKSQCIRKGPLKKKDKVLIVRNIEGRRRRGQQRMRRLDGITDSGV